MPVYKLLSLSFHLTGVARLTDLDQMYWLAPLPLEFKFFGTFSRFTVVSRMVTFPGGFFPGKSFPGWSFSRMRQFLND